MKQLRRAEAVKNESPPHVYGDEFRRKSLFMQVMNTKQSLSMRLRRLFADLSEC